MKCLFRKTKEKPLWLSLKTGDLKLILVGNMKDKTRPLPFGNALHCCQGKVIDLF